MSHLRRLFLAACIAATVIAASAPGAAHQKLVGVIQAQSVPQSGTVTVLLKLEVRALMSTLELGEIADDDPRLLTTDQGRHKVLDLLRRTHELEAWKGVCERDKIERFELTPSGAWLDVQTRYRCPKPVHYVMVRLDTLLDEEGHRIVGHFDAGDGAEKVVYNRRARKHFLLFDEELALPAATATTAPPHQSEKPPLSTLLLHPELGLLVLVLAGAVGTRRRRALLAACALGVGVGTVGILAATGAHWVPVQAGLVGLVLVGGLAARALIQGEELASWDLAIAGAAALVVAAAAGRDGVTGALGSPLSGLLVYFGVGAVGLVGTALGAMPKAREVLGFGVIAAIVFLGAGEAFRLI